MQGKSINGFTLQHPLGTGGMAEVWYAENKIGKKAAVKLLLPKLCQDENVKSRFLTEAKVMVDLNHPNIRQVYDYGDIDGRPAIVMEYLEGDDLKARMKRGQHFTDEELKRWWNQLVDALNYTHKKGIVHRDIKPGNIFVDNEGNIKLLDFGIAKVRESITSTQTGQKLGTLMYMSPEQVKDSKHIDYHTDIYSLAVTFVHLLTGKRPYDSDTSSDFEISEQIVYKPLDMGGLPAGWQSFLAPYLEKDSEKRPELRHFESIRTTDKPTTNAADEDDGTIVETEKELQAKPVAPKPQSKQTASKPVTKPQPKPASNSISEKPKSKKGLWIGLGIAAAALLLLLLIKPAEEKPVASDPDTETYQADENTYVGGNQEQEVPATHQQVDDNGNSPIPQQPLVNDNQKSSINEKVNDKPVPATPTNGLTEETAEQCYTKGMNYYQSENYTEAAKWFRKAADQGCASSQYELGLMYYEGEGVARNLAEAAKWYRKAANQGDAEAQYNLGYMYYNGEGVAQNLAEAAKWYRKAANQGVADAQYNLGYMYYYGQGVAQDMAEAKKWFSMAAAQGVQDAINCLNSMSF